MPQQGVTVHRQEGFNYMHLNKTHQIDRNRWKQFLASMIETQVICQLNYYFLYLHHIPAPLSQAHQGLQPGISSDGGRDHERQPYKVQVPRSWPPCHGHQPFWTQDPSAHGQPPHHNRGTAGRCCPSTIIYLLLLWVYFQEVYNSPQRVSLSPSHRVHVFMFFIYKCRNNNA